MAKQRGRPAKNQPDMADLEPLTEEFANFDTNPPAEEKPAEKPVNKPSKVITITEPKRTIEPIEPGFYEAKEVAKVKDGANLHLVKVNGKELWWTQQMFYIYTRDPEVEVVGDGSTPSGSVMLGRQLLPTKKSVELPRNTQLKIEPKTPCRGCR